MKQLLYRIWKRIKKEGILAIAFCLAAISALIVPPSAAYLDYIDVRVLVLLFCLMAVMAGFRQMGVFSAFAARLLQNVKNTRQMAAVLIMFCFFFSMIVTNDVALITFVPFGILMISMSPVTAKEKERLLITVIVLQTIAANLGSMLTPIGNPQNLYLYNLSGKSVGAFLLWMLPWTGVSLVLLLVSLWAVPRFSLTPQQEIKETSDSSSADEKKYNDRFGLPAVCLLAIYSVLFVLCLLTVFQVMSWKLLFVIMLLSLLVFSPKLLRQIDYSLLLTFVSFFVLIGNIGNISAVKDWFSEILSGREVIVGVLVSQVMSNVPAALLLSGFTNAYDSLLLGVNFGGLGTLIASLASLISYQAYANTADSKKGRYLLHFTLWNLGYLLILLCGWYLLGRNFV